MKLILLGICTVAAFAPSACSADLRMQFVYDGQPPKPLPVIIGRDHDFCSKHNLVDESLLVNPKNRGIANVIVYLYTGKKGTDLKQLNVPPPPNRKLNLVHKDCRFQPRVTIARVGDTLSFEDQDPVVHSGNISFIRRPAAGFLIPPGGKQVLIFGEPEPVPLPVKCNIHPWERATLLVLEHPFAAASDADGQLVIQGLPQNTPLMLRVFHETLEFKKNIIVNGQATAWQRNLFTHTIGEDDQVTTKVKVSLPPDEDAK